ncbi:pectinesterase family protein [Parapedobacter tibetensis]|uniref:pectinesterase family protein n=1 Tax=Parapedobacter tibetensis TaxID=2972951 RepID=UPI00214D84F6|nr:pectinesterase family protein [Parapedobacter tibetensis]
MTHKWCSGMTSLLACIIIAFSISPAATSCAKKKGKDTNETTAPNETNVIKADLVVAADGSGDFETVQEAINAAPTNSRSYCYIFIKAGTYKEVITIPHGKEYIYLIGEDVNKTILTYDNYAKRLRPDGTAYGTSGSSSFFANGSYFVAEKITFENTAGIAAGQALAINIGAARSSFRNCRFLGHQDTWYAAEGTIQYLEDCYIEGSVDFIFGGSTAFFDHCHVVSTRNGYITAASTPANQSFGYVFNKCHFTSVPDVGDSSVYLGRPWRPNASVVYLQCELNKHIHQAGWHNWNNADNERTAFYAEYNSKGEGASPSTRVPWSHQLTEEQVQTFSYEKVIGNQHPSFVDAAIVTQD